MIIKDDDLYIIYETIPKAALYESLAEEATELAQAAMKMARVLRNENPTPVTQKEAKDNLIEEYGDVLLTAAYLELQEDFDGVRKKHNRCLDRCEEVLRKKHSV